MRLALPRRGAFGLRGRIVGVVLVTTVATLAVAALALLGPLEQTLRNAEQTTLPAEPRPRGRRRLHARSTLDELPRYSGAIQGRGC